MSFRKRKVSDGGRYADPTSDYGFQQVFSDSQTVLEVLRLFSIPAASVRSIEPAAAAPSIGVRGVILDIVAQLEDGTDVRIEMHRVPYDDLGKRLIFYASRANTNSLAGGTPVTHPRCFTIAFTNFEFIGSGDKGNDHPWLLVSGGQHLVDNSECPQQGDLWSSPVDNKRVHLLR